jgi:hypothetical protein
MDKASAKWGRIALAAVTVAAVAALAFPANAMAHYATRIVVTKQYVADWSTPGSMPATPSVTAKLQKKVSGHWRSLTGTIRIYYQAVGQSGWVFLRSVKASSVKVTMLERGRYRLYHRYTSTTRSATAYTKRIDLIGESITPVSVTFGTPDATWTPVLVSYDLTWNTEAFTDSAPWPLEFSYVGWFEDAVADLYSGDARFYQETWEPGTVRFSYRVLTEDIPFYAPFDGAPLQSGFTRSAGS